MPLTCANELNVCCGNFQPSTTLFTVPAKAMINVKTLSSLYPAVVRKTLTATQLISLHLHLHIPSRDGDSSDPAFGPYISTIPRTFDSHPLSWILDHRSDSYEGTLLRLLPPLIHSSLKKVESRLMEDWRAVSHVLVSIIVVNALHPDSILHSTVLRGTHAHTYHSRLDHSLQMRLRLTTTRGLG